jgi:hypothetical protein
MLGLEGNQIYIYLSRLRLIGSISNVIKQHLLNFKMQMFLQHKAYETLGVFWTRNKTFSVYKKYMYWIIETLDLDKL